jgi:lysozyme
VSFTYNLGSGALQRSTLRRVINRQNHHNVPAQLMRWVWAGGRKLRGLVRRREAEALLYA